MELTIKKTHQDPHNHDACELCLFPLDVGDPVYIVTDGTAFEDGPYCSRYCARRMMERLGHQAR